MKKLTLLFCLSMAFYTQAQVNRFIYEYVYAPDVSKPKEFKKDLMVLDITDKESCYMSMKKFETDSMAYANPQAFLARALSAGATKSYTSEMNGGDITYKVIKNYPSYKTYLHEDIGSMLYKILDEKKQNWVISPEKEKVGTYTAQKATTSFGGRQWTAWFTTAIPIQDGPYKFHGLPGLIVKVEDQTQTHKMTLVANRKVKKTEFKSTGFSRHSGEVDVNEAKFKKAWSDYIKDPAQQARGMSFGGGNVKMINNGKEVTDNREMEKSIEKAAKSKEQRNSNKIEPDLYK